MDQTKYDSCNALVMTTKSSNSKTKQKSISKQKSNQKIKVLSKKQRKKLEKVLLKKKKKINVIIIFFSHLNAFQIIVKICRLFNRELNYSMIYKNLKPKIENML